MYNVKIQHMIFIKKTKNSNYEQTKSFSKLNTYFGKIFLALILV